MPLSSSESLLTWYNMEYTSIPSIMTQKETHPRVDHIKSPKIFPVLNGKVSLVTGGAQGIGKAIAEVFLKAGAIVVIADIQETTAQKTVKELQSLGEVSFCKADISNPNDVKNMIAYITTKYGRLDIAVNNAALTPDKTPFVDFDVEYWKKTIDINLTGTALCCKHELQQMIAQKTPGSIVNIASINAFKVQPNMPAYTAAKHAVLGLTKHAAMEGGPYGIRVNAIAPGPILV
ncbi:hypothetical protein ASPWEDRAFT_35754 [Aspergillus wentii DTO 134E9]|uniref:Uncharacterized protein n=1 Tax=Aspergillus wentii DTO 134E9 TaxID=1073089 RepID=A0A1L9RTE7_ASPWE|nr:uncharacterized protein ASPWEDRAFT_35754 [Aspergillus wentii DTO 134E9]OJJ38174.1 hypothetical protein ASPWEDRAFT_35754 [Aspergillus wentii DTO 134E9]